VIVRGVLEYGVIGVFALMAVGIGTGGVGVFSSLGALVLAVGIGRIRRVRVPVRTMRVVAGVSPVAFAQGAQKDAMLTAFATRSSSRTLPVTMTNAEGISGSKSGCTRSRSPGATANMDGAAIRRAIAP